MIISAGFLFNVPSNFSQKGLEATKNMQKREKFAGDKGFYFFILFIVAVFKNCSCSK